MDKNPLLSRACVVVGEDWQITNKQVRNLPGNETGVYKCSSEQMTQGTERSCLGCPGARVFP